MTQAPKESGYTMPAEWEKHSSVWLAWPHDAAYYFPERVEKMETAFCQLLSALTESETVNLIVKDDASKVHAIEILEKLQIKTTTENLRFHITEYVDIWTRDYCPSFVINKQNNKLGAVCWKYNGYGNKFPDLINDGLVPQRLRKEFGGDDWFMPNIFTEGGALEVNGKGTVIVTEQCLLNPNRNPELNKTQVEKILNDNLGTTKVIWLKEGVIYDPTDGHTDDFVRFVDEHTILCGFEDDVNHKNYRILDDAYNTLCQETDQDGQPFKVIKLPMPEMFFDRNIYFNTNVAPVSYANFYIGNTVVVVPTFEHPNDQKALKIISSCFPNHKIITVDCRDIVYGGGTIHCITQQVPLI